MPVLTLRVFRIAGAKSTCVAFCPSAVANVSAAYPRSYGEAQDAVSWPTMKSATIRLRPAAGRADAYGSIK